MKKNLLVLILLSFPLWSVSQECDDDVIITLQPIDTSVTENGTIQFTVEGANYDDVFWTVRTVSGSSTVNLVSNNAVYSGATTTTLTLQNIPLSYDGYEYRATLIDPCNESVRSNWVTLTVKSIYTSIPDPNFEAALSAYDDIVGDGQVPTANIENVTELNLRSQSISDLTGVEAFINLENLNAGENALTGAIDLTANQKLVYVSFFRNDITSIDVTNLAQLEELYLSYTDITALDVSTNIALKKLSISYSTSIANLDLSDLTNLEDFDAFRATTLTTLTLKNNTSLKELSAGRCNLSSLAFEECPNLEDVYLNLNNFTSVDFRSNPLLFDVDVSQNQLTTVDLRTGNTATFTNINLENNPDLTCVSIDDPVYAWRLLAEGLDDQTSYSKECGTYTFIPDDNFETALNTLGIDDIANDNHILNSNAAVINNLDVSTSGITDLTGIAAFSNLTSLSINENQVQEIDLSANVLLENLDVSENLLQILDLSMLTSLSSVNVQENLLFDFNLQNGNNTNITGFSADSNADLACILVDDETFATTNFTNIDPQTNFSSTACGTVYTAIPDSNFEDGLSAYDDIPNDGQVPRLAIYNVEFINITARGIADVTGIEDFYSIERIDLARNNISAIDLSSNLKLRELEIDSNNLTALDVTKNIALQELILEDNNLTTIDLSENTLLKILDVSRNDLVAIDLTNNVLLEKLNLSNIDITSVDLSKNVALLDLEFDDNLVTNLDLTHNVLLEDLEFDGGGALQSVDLTGLTALDYFYIEDGGNLNAIDFSTNIGLTELEFYETNVTSLDLSNNLLLEDVYITDNTNLTEVIFSNQTYPVLDRIEAEDTALESIDVANFPVLNNLDISRTNIQNLDVSNNPELIDLRATNAQLEILNVQNGNNAILAYFDITGNPNLTCVQVDDVDYANTNFTNKDVQTNYSTDCTSCVVNARAFLEGPFDSASFAMKDDLRANNILPTTSPYQDAATCDASIFDTTGNNAIVDWVEIQLRNPDDVSEILYRKSAFLRSNSAIIDTDGNTDITINGWQGKYYVAIAHRNHLSVATSSALTFDGNEANVDFTDDAGVLNGSNALIEVTTGIFALPSGDADGNGQVQNSDIIYVTQLLGGAGYSNADLDLNGQVQNSDINNLLNSNLGKGEQF